MPTDTQENPPQNPVYRLVVRSAEEAVQTIRERFGGTAKVLSVKQVENSGVLSLFSRPKIEVLVQVGSTPKAEVPASFVGAQEPQANMSAPVESAASSKEAEATQSKPAETGANPEAQKAAAAKEPQSIADLLEKPTLEIRRSRTEATPTGNDLPDLLRRSGFSEAFVTRMRALPCWAKAHEHPLHVTLVDLGKDLKKMLEKRRFRPLPARTAFIGSMGVGRTTALCKWLGNEVFTKGRRGRVLKVEFDRPNPAENLAVYAEALGLGVEHYSPELDLSIADGEFLYADLPGFEFRRPMANNQIASFLNTAKFEGRVLVLNALYDHASLRAAYSAGKELGATHLVFTHCDELLHWGKLMDVLIDGEITPLFLATGPSLSGDCDEDCIGAVLRKTIPGA